MKLKSAYAVCRVAALVAGLGPAPRAALAGAPETAAKAAPNVATTAEPGASTWVESEYAASRLIATQPAFSPEDSTLLLAWEVVLKKGWKTYWRSPGEAGVPPMFSWEGSVNLAAAELRYPLPRRFELFDFQTFGYGGRLLMPILIRPRVKGAPVTVRASVKYLICETVCIPLDASFELDLPAAEGEVLPTPFALDIHESLAAVPTEQAAPGSGLRIVDARLYGPPGNQRLTVEVAAARLLSGADLLVEAGEGIMFDAPRRALLGDGTRALFTMAVGGYEADIDLHRRPLTLTFSDGWGAALEKTVVPN